MYVSRIGVSSPMYSFKGNIAKSVSKNALLTNLKLSAIKMEIPAEQINNAKGVEKLKELIRFAKVKERGEAIGIKPENGETCSSFMERVDFVQYKLKALDHGISTEEINACKKSSELKEKLMSEDMQKKIREKKEAELKKEAESSSSSSYDDDKPYGYWMTDHSYIYTP